MTFSDIRNVHVKGHISICTDRTSSSRKFLTCGTDGTVYVWDENSITNGEAPEIKSVADATHSCCAWNGENVFVGLTTTDLLTGVDKRIVGHCLLNNLESFRQIFSFSLEVNSIDASENYVVAGGSDFTVKKVNLNMNGPYDRFDTSGEVLSVSIDPKEEAYAVSCSDGTVSVFDIKSNEKLCCAEFMFTSFGDIGVANPRQTLTWSTDGSCLFIPSQGCVKIIDRNVWTLSNHSLKCEETALDIFSTSCITQCGQYLCTSTLSNKILVWKLDDRSVLAHYEYRRKDKATISNMKFIPFNQRDVVLVDVYGGLCVLKEAIPSSAMNIEGVVKSGGFVTDKTIPMNEKEHDITVLSRGRFEDEDNDEDSRMSAHIGAIKKKYGFSNEPNHLDDYGFVIANRTVCDNSIVPEKESGSSFVPSALHVNYQPPTIPSYFVSGASPIHLTERYLKWNHYGTVRTYVDDNGSSLEISFHDVSIHPTIVLDNRATGYVLADLSDQAVALANRIEEKFEQSELFVIHISSWDSESRRWSTNLPQGESALDVMVSREMVCVISDKRKIRIFTLAGTQRHIISHPNPMLTATCFGIHIAICSVLGGDYYEKSCRVQPNYQHVVSIYNVDSKQWYHHKELVKTVNLPVACEKRLLWIGYTNVGQLVSMDSSYSINLLAPSGFWLPIFDGSNEIANKSDAIWPVAVTEGNHRHVRYLYCKGSKYPLVAIKMAPVVAPWNLPFCAPDSDKSKLEQELFLNELQMNESFSSESSPDLADLTSTHLKSLVKLFALACKSERDGRAAELAGLVTSAKGILMMCNYAAKLKKSTLADKVASKGRESISLGKPNFYDNSCSNQEEIPMPRPFSLKKKETMQPSSMSAVDSKEYSPKSPSQSNDESNNMENHESSTSQEGNQTISTQCAVPIPRYNKNPFKKSESLADTSSVFDTSTVTVSKKRVRENEDITLSVPKQTKLQFSSATNKNKENSCTAYSLWMENNEESLRKIFSGNPEDFVRFCVQQFRLLSAAEKKQWKTRAES